MLDLLSSGFETEAGAKATRSEQLIPASPTGGARLKPRPVRVALIECLGDVNKGAIDVYSHRPI